MASALAAPVQRSVAPPRRVRTGGGRVRAAGPTKADYRAAVTTGLEEVIDQLRGALGASLVGVIASVDRKTLQRWNPDRRPRQAVAQRLRAAWQAYGLLAPAEDPETIRQWFMGMNPDLADVSPAEEIADGDHRGVLAAARGFAADG